MIIAVRMDDITPDMDWERFERVISMLRAAGVKPLLGVVPDNRDDNLAKDPVREDFWEKMCALRAEGYSIALHGYRHIYTTGKGGLFPLNLFSEYAGISYEEQFEMLREGKEILRAHGIETDLFMAPAHSYDKNTLKALKAAGFTGLTDGFGTRPYRRAGLVFYPISSQLSKAFSDRGGYTTMVIHSNTMNEGDFRALQKRLEAVNKKTIQLIDYEEYRKVEPTDRGIFGDLKEWMMATGKRVMIGLLSRRGN